MKYSAADTETVFLFCRMILNRKKEIIIRTSEMEALMYIVNSEEPITPINIADFFKVSKSMVTLTINSLIKNDFLEKTPSLSDRRSFSLTPTQKGVDLVKESYKEYNKDLEFLKTNLGVEDYSNLMTLLDKSSKLLFTMK